MLCGKGYSWEAGKDEEPGEKAMVRKELYLRREREARICQLEREWIGEDKRNRLRSSGSWELKQFCRQLMATTGTGGDGEITLEKEELS